MRLKSCEQLISERQAEAERIEANLQAEMKELRENSANALEP